MKVLAETTAQVLVDDTITLPLPAEKIDEIVASIRDLECFVIENKVIFRGILHKQIFFVDEKGFVRHVGVDVPFSGFVDVAGVPAGSSCQVTGEVVFINFSLISKKELRETVVIDIEVTVFDTQVRTAVGTNCPVMVESKFGCPGTIRVRNNKIIQ
ncbi:MAG TPA: DUF3794 domain-containing protein [Bacillota bacterium]